MGSKDKTISFRVKEEQFDALKDVSDDLDPSLSQIFRDFVSSFNDHNGRVQAVPTHEIPDETSTDEFPVQVEVSKSMVREHERLELEAEHLREQLQEHRSYASQLETKVEEAEAESAEVVVLEDLEAVSEFQITSD